MLSQFVWLSTLTFLEIFKKNQEEYLVINLLSILMDCKSTIILKLNYRLLEPMMYLEIRALMTAGPTLGKMEGNLKA